MSLEKGSTLSTPSSYLVILEGSRHPNFMNPFGYGKSSHNKSLDKPKKTGPKRVNGDEDDDCKKEEDAQGWETPTVLALESSRHLIPERRTKNIFSLFKQVRSV